MHIFFTEVFHGRMQNNGLMPNEYYKYRRKDISFMVKVRRSKEYELTFLMHTG
jgi:hypothetical protein